MRLELILGALLVLSAAAYRPGGKTTSFTGEISDSQCATKVHSPDGSHTEMLKLKGYGRSAADCARTCVREFGGRFVLVQAETGRVYRLEPQEKLEAFAGQRVVVEGSLDQKEKSIHVVQIKPVEAGTH